MGLNFIRAKAEHFEQLRDAACESELGAPDLLTRLRSDLITHFFNCQLTDDDADLTPGLFLVARAYSESDVRLMQRSKYIGHVLPGEAEVLTTLMRKNYCYGFISLVIDSVAGFDGVFRVRPKKPFLNS